MAPFVTWCPICKQRCRAGASMPGMNARTAKQAPSQRMEQHRDCARAEEPAGRSIQIEQAKYVRSTCAAVVSLLVTKRCGVRHAAGSQTPCPTRPACSSLGAPGRASACALCISTDSAHARQIHGVCVGGVGGGVRTHAGGTGSARRARTGPCPRTGGGGHGGSIGPAVFTRTEPKLDAGRCERMQAGVAAWAAAHAADAPEASRSLWWLPHERAVALAAGLRGRIEALRAEGITVAPLTPAMAALVNDHWTYKSDTSLARVQLVVSTQLSGACGCASTTAPQ